MICPQKDETDPIPKTVNACIENNIVFHEINQVPKLLSLWWRLVPVGASSLRARLWKTLTEGFLSGWSFIHIALMVPYLQQHRTQGDTDARHAEQHHAHAQPKKKIYIYSAAYSHRKIDSGVRDNAQIGGHESAVECSYPLRQQNTGRNPRRRSCYVQTALASRISNALSATTLNEVVVATAPQFWQWSMLHSRSLCKSLAVQEPTSS